MRFLVGAAPGAVFVAMFVAGALQGRARADRAKPPESCHARPILVEGREVSADAADRLRQLPSTLRAARPGEYRLVDGRVLLQPDEGEPGVIYTAAEYARRESLVQTELRLRHVGENESFHPLRGLIDDGARFGAEAASLAGAFEKRLAREGLPTTADGADAFAARWREAGCRVEPDVFRELVAYVGRLATERLAQGKHAGAWATRDEDGFVAPVVEWHPTAATPAQPPSHLTTAQAISPWRLAALLVDGDGAPAENASRKTMSLAALVDEAIARAATEAAPATAAPAASAVAPR